MIPRCQKCGAEVSVSLGLPVSVTFSKTDDEACVATLDVDTDELDVDFYALCECSSQDGRLQAELTDEDADRLVAVLGAIAKRYAPSLDCVITAQDVEDDMEEAIGA